jgi:hypothetical protein
MRFTVLVGEEETLVNFEMTSNVFQETELTPDFLINYDENSSLKGTMGIGACLSTCKKSFTKGDGLGACKAGCLAELAIKAAIVAVMIAAL